MMGVRFKKPKPISSKKVSVLTDLPAPAPGMDRFTEYSGAQINRTKLLLQHDLFCEVAAAIDGAYKAIQIRSDHVSPSLARIYLVCHQALFAALSCIFRGMPLDAGAPTRRALEAARTALAIKLDPENGKRWLQYETRMERWAARQRDEKPPRLEIGFDVLSTDQLGKELGKQIGILSDAQVHFTPEYMTGLTFKVQHGGKQLFSPYIETNEHQTARHLRWLAAPHILILRTLNRCADNGFEANVEFLPALAGISAAAKKLFEVYPPDLPVEADGEFRVE